MHRKIGTITRARITAIAEAQFNSVPAALNHQLAMRTLTDGTTSGQHLVRLSHCLTLGPALANREMLEIVNEPRRTDAGFDLSRAVAALSE